MLVLVLVLHIAHWHVLLLLPSYRSFRGKDLLMWNKHFVPFSFPGICADIESQLYDKYELNFLSAVPRQLLEDIAAATVASGTAMTSNHNLREAVDLGASSLELRHDLIIYFFFYWRKGSNQAQICVLRT